MYAVPERFRPKIRVEYPPNNKILFEEWFFDHHVDLDRTYLPVFFTSYQVNNKYGKDKGAMIDLQEFIDSIDRNGKYYLPCQYDDGPLVNFNGLDIKVFGSGGGRIDYPIPLVTIPHPYRVGWEKKVFCSFAGSITHPMRAALFGMFTGKSGYQMEREVLKIGSYCDLMNQSVFALCPRGYGKTSFRICEALQFGSIPVYISDEFIIPGHKDFNEYGVLIHSDQIVSKQEAGKRIYEKMFTFEGCKKLILDNL